MPHLYNKIYKEKSAGFLNLSSSTVTLTGKINTKFQLSYQ